MTQVDETERGGTQEEPVASSNASMDKASESNNNEQPEEVAEEVAPTSEVAKINGDSSFWTRINHKYRCFPGFSKQIIPLGLCFLATFFTGVGSWGCTYFSGATISFTGGKYGLWTLEDVGGKCQRWDVLFFSYSLGRPLVAARVFSMASMLIGLGLLTTMTQALQFHAVSWLIFLQYFTIFMISVTTTSIYNMWVVFFLFTYFIYILIVRAAFIHPVHRRISQRGSHIIAAFLAVCGVCNIFTLVVLKSDFCTCKNIDSATLSGREPGDPCQGTCGLGLAGYVIIVAAALWLLSAAAVLRFGVQPPIICLEGSTKQLYGFYPRDSLTTRVVHLNKRVKFQFDRGLATVSNVTSGAKTVSDGAANAADETEEGQEAAIETQETVENEEEPDSRSFCAKACCDYRVTPRTKKEKRTFWSFRVALGLMIAMYVFLVVVLIGSRGENTTAAQAPDTSSNFITDVVCAFNPLDPNQPFETFPHKDEARAAGLTVAHCGACSFCSTPHDIEVYVETRKTIAKSAKSCGMTAMFGSYMSLVECLENRIGFTRECTFCWADNMKTTGRRCLFTCMVTMFTGFMSNNNVPGAGDQGWLNQCLFCDEKLAGTAFVTCSGVARRRLGIASEIERNPEEQCRLVDVDWITVDWSSIFPSRNN